MSFPIMSSAICSLRRVARLSLKSLAEREKSNIVISKLEIWIFQLLSLTQFIIAESVKS